MRLKIFTVWMIAVSSTLCSAEIMKIAMEEGQIAPSSQMAEILEQFHDKITQNIAKAFAEGQQPNEKLDEFQVTILHWGTHGLKITFFGLLDKKKIIDATSVVLAGIKDSNVRKVRFEFFEKKEKRSVRNADDGFTSVEFLPVNKVSSFEWIIIAKE